MAEAIADLIEPMPGLIAVSIDTKGEWTPQGLLIPLDTARTIHEAKPTFGTVVAVGDEAPQGTDDEDVDIAIGDVVLFSKYSGTRVSRTIEEEVDGKRGRREEVILIMRRTDVLARVKSDATVNLKVRS